MAFRLEFYKSRTGVEPALEYIRAQPKRHRAKIGRALQYLEDMGNLARRPHVDYLGNDIYELRVAIENHQHRLLYFFHGRSLIVITCGLLKNVDKVPPSEIKQALQRRTEWMERFGGDA